MGVGRKGSAKVALEAWGGVEVAEELGVEGCHDYAEGEEDGPADGGWVVSCCFQERHWFRRLGVWWGRETRSKSVVVGAEVAGTGGGDGAIVFWRCGR